MVGFTVIGIAVCVIAGTLLAGVLLATLITLGKDDLAFYSFMFFGAWIISTLGLITQLVTPLLSK